MHKSTFPILLILLTLLPLNIAAQKFDINTELELRVKRSTESGKKMIEVYGYGSSADKAMEQAYINAVSGILFFGVEGSEEMGPVPSVLLDKVEAYNSSRKLFNDFFKKGTHKQFAHNVNSHYPYGPDNVKTPKGRRVRLVLIVDYEGLTKYFKEYGFKTTTGDFSEWQ